MNDNHIADERQPIYQARSLQEEKGRFRDYSKCAFDSLHPWLFEKRIVYAAPIAPRADAGTAGAKQVYQEESQGNPGVWMDISAELYIARKMGRIRGGKIRVLNAAGASERADAEKDAALNTLFEILMQQNIVTGAESYLSLRCVGVPPAQEAFVQAVKRAILAANGEKK